MKKIERFLDKYLSPVANYMNNNLFFSSLAEAFMRLTPILLGGAFVLLIGNFPITAWTNFLKAIGFEQFFLAAQNATMNAIALYVVFNFAYTYVKKCGYEPLSAGLIAVASFFTLMPQSYNLFETTNKITKVPVEATVTGMKELTAFSTNYVGATGMIVAILIGWLVAKSYIFLNKKNLVIKLPTSVPPNVSESLRPALLSGVILVAAILARALFAFAPFLREFGDIFTLVAGLIQLPLQSFVSSPFAIIMIFTMANILWFFGIHPNMIYGVVLPILTSCNIENQVAFKAGLPLPYLYMAVISLVVGNQFGGQGSTLGLVISMFTAKSKRYKEMLKLAGLPAIFNINEPLIFGMPVMLNPIFFLPMIIVPIVTGFTAWGMIKLLTFTELNPLLSLPWTAPGVIVTLLKGGWKFFVIGLVAILISVIVWYPFFRFADKRALDEEHAGNEED